jgi:membrane protein implicated in regulation of membrane protease activity
MRGVRAAAMDVGNPRMLVLMTLATVLVLGGILALATHSWWALIIPVALHALGSVVVIGGVFKRTEEGDKPDPVTQARLDDERAGRAG